MARMTVRGQMLAKITAALAQDETFVPLWIVGQREGQTHLSALGPSAALHNLGPLQREWLRAQWHFLGHLLLQEGPCVDCPPLPTGGPPR